MLSCGLLFQQTIQVASLAPCLPVASLKLWANLRRHSIFSFDIQCQTVRDSKTLPVTARSMEKMPPKVLIVSGNQTGQTLRQQLAMFARRYGSGRLVGCARAICRYLREDFRLLVYPFSSIFIDDGNDDDVVVAITTVVTTICYLVSPTIGTILFFLVIKAVTTITKQSTLTVAVPVQKPRPSAVLGFVLPPRAVCGVAKKGTKSRLFHSHVSLRCLLSTCIRHSSRVFVSLFTLLMPLSDSLQQLLTNGVLLIAAPLNDSSASPNCRHSFMSAVIAVSPLTKSRDDELHCYL